MLQLFLFYCDRMLQFSIMIISCAFRIETAWMVTSYMNLHATTLNLIVFICHITNVIFIKITNAKVM